jgi:exodeoxyribonuclease VII large subunit
MLLHPASALDRGYALVTDADGQIIRTAGRMSRGDYIRLHMSDGAVNASVTGVTLKPNSST